MTASMRSQWLWGAAGLSLAAGLILGALLVPMALDKIWGTGSIDSSGALGAMISKDAVPGGAAVDQRRIEAPGAKGMIRLQRSEKLLLIDLEMPGRDGSMVLSYTVSAGVNRQKIIILSGHDAEYLHERFPMGSCLAVLNKFEAQQETVLDMIFDSLQEKISEQKSE